MDLAADYHKIAEALIRICPAGFEEAKLEATVEEDWSEKTYRCKLAGEWTKGLASPADVDFTVDDALESVRTTMAGDSNQKWSTCTFVLYPTGKFKMDVGYAD